MAGPARTPLHALHLRLGARMGPFAGYELPIQFPAGVLKEHLHVRAAAGLFDVSHMGQIVVRPRSGGMAAAAAALEALTPADVAGLAEGRQRYALLTGANGGILDDLMIARLPGRFLLVVNAARKADDLALLREGLGCEVEPLEAGLIALQGPAAEAALARLAPEAAGLAFMDVAELTLDGAPAVVSRSGYTGEDGFEISLPAAETERIAERLLADPAVRPAGLGARDSLRLEAGLCLHGQDIDAATTPVEAALEWAAPRVRRRGGARAGGFPGADVILGQIEAGAARRRVMLLPEGAPMRAGVTLHADPEGPEIGSVTSGGFGPSLGAPIAMGYVPTALAAPGTPLLGRLRGRMQPVKVAAAPLLKPGYKRA